MKSDRNAATAFNQPVWEATAQVPTFFPLQEDLHVDVCVIGAGIAGLTTAYLLALEGRSVAVLTDGVLAGGSSGATTAHLSNAMDDRYFEVERLHGVEGARRAAESHTAAITRIEDIVRHESIPCHFERLDGYLFVPPGEAEELLDRELAAARRAGLQGVEMVNRVPWGHFDTGPCLRFPKQGQFHPLQYMAGLVKAIQRDGGRIFTDTRADQIEGGSVARITAGRNVVTAGAVVVATSSPVNDRRVPHKKQAAYRSYVIGARVPRRSVAKALYWDTQHPHHSVRLTGAPKGADYDILIVGGEDHKTGQADDGRETYARLEAWARDRFPISKVENAWAGQILETIDGLAFIGRNPPDKENVFIATGDSGLGMTHGTIAGIVLTDLILNRAAPWATH